MSSPIVNDAFDLATVYMGVWTNWSEGQVRGVTLTTTTAHGAFLIAFLAIFVQFTGTHFWGIVRFVLHQYRAKKGSHDAIYHQQQAVLRNTSSDDAVIGLLRVVWAWKSSTKIGKPLLRSLALICTAALHLMGCTVAAIFSTTASTALGDEVLISSPYCGFVNAGTSNLTAFENIITSYTSKVIQDSANYARSCYSGEGGIWHDCSTYASTRLPTFCDTHAPCPFGSDICIAPAFQLDTGRLSSNKNFGLNAPPKNRVDLRKVVTCAPIDVDRFSTVKNGTSILTNYTTTTDLPEMQYVELDYGNFTYLTPSGAAESNYTYRYRSQLENFNNQAGSRFPEMAQYFLYSATAFAGDPPPYMEDLIPRPFLHRNDADISLAFLSSNSIVYSNATDDPWYSAHSNPLTVSINGSALNENSDSIINATVYFRDHPVSVLGCAEQYQICNPGSDHRDICSPLTGLYALNREGLGLNNRQKITADALFSTTTTIGSLLEILGTSALTARNSLHGAMQASLPDNQWTLEVEGWFNSILAQIQRAVLEYATGPSDPNLLPFILKAEGIEKMVCRNQKARTAKAQNFNVLAIVLIFALGTLIIVINTLLDQVVSTLQKRSNPSNHRRLAWKTDAMLQTQRLAHEELGFSTWMRCTKEVPITDEGEMLAMLCVQDPHHPVLQRRTILRVNKSTSTVDLDQTVIGEEEKAKALQNS